MKNFSGYTFCFLGKSGSGKDTQVNLLKKNLEKQGCKILFISTGDQGRILKEKNTFVGHWIRNILETGGLFPSWLATTLWFCVLKEELIEDEVVLFPSSPRTIEEAKSMDDVMGGGGRPLPTPIYLDISGEEATKRLLTRGRSDDNGKAIANRLSWFETDVLPIVKYYGIRCLRIDAHGSVEEVHQKIMSALNELKN